MGETIQYRNFEIRKALVSYSPATDWAWSHKDFDGAPDANDTRCGYSASVHDAKLQIDEWHEENTPCEVCGGDGLMRKGDCDWVLDEPCENCRGWG